MMKNVKVMMKLSVKVANNDPIVSVNRNEEKRGQVILIEAEMRDQYDEKYETG